MLEIREMLDGDIEEVSALEEKTFSMPWGRQDFLDMIHHKDALYLVALREKRIVGVCGVLNAAGDGDITNVAVAEELRGQGIGQAMLKELIHRGKDIGITAFTLEVRVSNQAAIHVYEKLGFEGAGVRPKFYEKPVEDALIMWKR